MAFDTSGLEPPDFGENERACEVDFGAAGVVGLLVGLMVELMVVLSKAAEKDRRFIECSISSESLSPSGIGIVCAINNESPLSIGWVE
jgi:hypothetical protein